MRTTRIYLVEDEALIVMEISDRLTQLGYEICGTAARGEQALEEIPQRRPDLVLMDICLAGRLNGIETAARLRRLLNVPIIFLSAFSDTKLVEEAVGAGAFGYLVKPIEIRELHATIQAAFYKHRLECALQEANADLEQAVLKRTVELSRSEAQLRNLFDGTSDLIQSVALDGRFHFVNRAWRETLGYSADEVTALTIFDIIHTSCRDQYRDLVRRIIAGENPELIEISFQAKDGRVIVADGRVSLRMEDGRPVAAQGLFRNITEHKRMETSLQALNSRLDFLLSSAPVTIYTCKPTAPYAATFVSANLTGMLGYTVEEFLSTPGFWADRIHPADRDWMFAELPRLFAQGSHLHEYRFQHKNGSWRWVSDALRVVPGPDGKATELIGSFIDVTERKVAEETVCSLNQDLEQLVAERTEKLRESEARYRHLMSTVPGAVYEFCIDTAGHRSLPFISQNIADLTGISSAEAMADVEVLFQRIPAHAMPAMEQSIRHSLEHLSPWLHEFPIRATTGEVKWLSGHSIPSRQEDGATCWIGVLVDLTAQKQAEETLRENEARLVHALDATSDGIWDWDIRTGAVYYSPQWMRLLGYQPTEVSPTVDFFLAILHPDDTARTMQIMQDHMEKRAPAKEVENRLRVKSGEYRWFLDRGKVIEWDKNGAPLRMVGTITDITERKRTEVLLRFSQEKLRQALYASNTGLWDWSTDTNEVSFSREWKRQLGYDEEDLPDVFETWESRLHSEDRARAVAYVQGYLAHPEGEYRQEFRLRHKDGSYRWIEARASFVTESDGRRIRLVGSHTDITERKQTESALQFLSTGIARLRGDTFFSEMAVQVAKLLDLEIGFVGKLLTSQTPRLRAIGLSIDGQALPPVEYDLAGTPCERVIGKETVIFTENVQQLFPDDRMLVDLGVSSYAAIPLFDMNGRPIGHLGVMSRNPLRQSNHVEDLLRLFARPAAAELERQRTEMKFQDLFDFSPDAVIMVNQEGLIVMANRQAESMFGYSRAEFMDLPVESLMPDSERQGHIHLRQQFFAAATPRMMGAGRPSLNALRKDGTIFPADISLSPIQSEEGPLVAAAVRDITERKRMEQALQNSERYNRQLFEMSPLGLALCRMDGTFKYLNEAFIRIIGRSQAETIHLTYWDITPPQYAAQEQAQLKSLHTTGQYGPYEKEYIHKDGHLVPVRLSGVIVEHDGERFIWSTVEDITEYKQAEQALNESEERFRILFEQAAVGVAQINTATGRFVRINQKYCEIVGYSQAEMLTLNFQQLTHPDDLGVDQDNMARLLAGNIREFNMEKRYARKDGAIVWVKLVVSPMWQPGATPDYHIAVVQDITARKQAEEASQEFQEQIRQMQKMEAIGQLAGGVAHDFNNIIAAVLGNAEMAYGKIASDHPSRLNLTRILEAGERASRLVQQILTFTRQQPLVRVVQPLAPVVAEVVTLLRAILPAGIALPRTIDQATPPVLADATQLHQVLMNLCTNAWHALGDQPGSIAVELAPVTLTQPLRTFATTLPPGSYVRLSVCDTGCGMDPDTVARIFDPFFTTKPVGQGTGLGLSVVHSIVQRHDGAIVVDSQSGQGTTFHLYFHAVETPALVCEPAEAAAVPTTRQSHRHLLYLDDEVMLVELVRAQFEPLGYRVTGYTSPAKALEAIRADPKGFDLVMTDYNMPGLSGLEVARAVSQIRADLPVVLVTGYLSPAVQAAARTVGIREIVAKPATVQHLAGVLTRLLDTPPSA